jgi:hypothetical protein
MNHLVLPKFQCLNCKIWGLFPIQILVPLFYLIFVLVVKLKKTYNSTQSEQFQNLIAQSQRQIQQLPTVKPAHVVTSIMQSPVLKGHPFLILS